MRTDVVLLPSHLNPAQLQGRAVVVLDVLRATTTMIAALSAGVREIRIFPDTRSARAAATENREALLCGEENCLKPAGFDLGNSPASLNSKHAGRTLFMSTTNGTRAILSARGAPQIIVGALVNAGAVAARIKKIGLDLLLLCAGTNGKTAMEDLIGAGAVLSALGENIELESDTALLAMTVFQANSRNLRSALRQSQGGINVIRAGLEEDIDFAANLDSLYAVGMVEDGDPIKVVRAAGTR
ncbi:MAG TPA: 2-phosphosulfolactate phosphatase [Tepidisphaeraceae bacterium]|jgi:2-phosphosulfolactate phosphatase|nr:2-phosphosulfolactate phosphatase [Tepidisphaeraceae bacterium]